MSDVQMFWSLCVKCIEFLSQIKSGAVLMESSHGEGQTDKQGGGWMEYGWMALLSLYLVLFSLVVAVSKLPTSWDS